MLCPNCETENRDDARFCDECGFPLSGSISRAAGAASPTRAEEEEERPAPRRGERKPQENPFGDNRGDGRYSSKSSGWDFDSEDEGLDDVFAEPRGRDTKRGDVDRFDDWQSGYGDSGAVYGSGKIRKEDDQDDAFKPAFSSYEDKSGYDEFFSDDYDYEAGNDADDADDTLDFGDDFWRNDNTDEIPRVEHSGQIPSRDYRVSSRKPPMSKGRVTVIVLGALVAVAAVVAVLGFALGVWGGKPIPDVTGMTEADARSVLEDEGFTVRTTQVKSDETEGLVLIMDPGAGSLAPEGSEVIIHIATARFIPDIQGKSIDEATALLEEAGYENVKYESRYTNDEEGIVMEVSPEAGTRAKSSMEVVVTVSENYKVPDISGKDLDGAIAAIEDAGLVAEVVYIDSDQYADGTIIGTTPEAGTKVSEGDYVSITVTRTRGVELVALTEELLAEGSTITIDGVDWQIESVISISYQGDDTVAYTATGKPMVSVRGQTLVGSSETVDGTVVWSSDNEVISIG